MRTFNSGATRNDDEGKYDFEGFYSPIVIERFGQYMNKHRKQADGKLRDSDNWQRGFGDKHLDVCIKSAWRHFLDLWKQHRGYPGQDTLEDSLCALLFNIQAYLFKILKDKTIMPSPEPVKLSIGDKVIITLGGFFGMEGIIIEELDGLYTVNLGEFLTIEPKENLRRI